MIRRFRIALATVVALTVCAWAAQQMSVQVKETQMRAKPSFLGGGVASLAYGARVTILEDKGAWLRVRSVAGREGWVHRSALSDKKIKLASGSKDAATGAASDELALAGKGFNSEVEDAFKGQNKQLDFTWVDRMGTWVVSAQDAQAFLTAGKVVPETEVRP